jgi:hypothetical protein
MAKQSYKVPEGLDKTILESEISLSKNFDFSASVGSLLIYLGFFLGGIFILINTFLSSGTGLQKFLFIIGWAMLTVVTGQYLNTKELGFVRIFDLLSYLEPGARRVGTRSSDSAVPFQNLVGIKTVDENGLIQFLDGRVGYLYDVVGSASLMLFDADRDRILDLTDAFYRKMFHGIELSFITVKEPQSVALQTAYLKQRYDSLRANKKSDPQLLDLCEAQFQILKNHVGKSYHSIHQYMVLMARDIDLLRRAESIIQADVSDHGLMIKSLYRLSDKEVARTLSSIYKMDGGRG